MDAAWAVAEAAAVPALVPVRAVPAPVRVAVDKNRMNWKVPVVLLNAIKTRIKPSAEVHPPSAILHHYVRENEHEKSRIHLRIDPDGTGTLIVNANRVMHLNPTAALMAHLLLEEKADQEIIQTIRASLSSEIHTGSK